MACTCELEQAFSAEVRRFGGVDFFHVYDAEGTLVAIAPTMAYAELIAHALRQLDEPVRHSACVDHPDGVIPD